MYFEIKLIFSEGRNYVSSVGLFFSKNTDTDFWQVYHLFLLFWDNNNNNYNKKTKNKEKHKNCLICSLSTLNYMYTSHLCDLFLGCAEGYSKDG